MSEAVLLIAHGSREPLANEEVEALANQLAEQTGSTVAVAFLDEVAQPNIPEVIDRLAASGVQSLIVLPYFLNSGTHVQKDIPALIATKQAEHPQLKIALREHLGSRAHILQLLKSMINA